MKAHKHAAIIKAWADGAQVQSKFAASAWEDITGTPGWAEHNEYRIKPAAPKVSSTISEAQLRITWHDANPLNQFNPLGVRFNGDIAKACADAALAHALESQQVVLMSEVQETARNLAKQMTADAMRATIQKEYNRVNPYVQSN